MKKIFILILLALTLTIAGDKDSLKAQGGLFEGAKQGVSPTPAPKGTSPSPQTPAGLPTAQTGTGGSSANVPSPLTPLDIKNILKVEDWLDLFNLIANALVYLIGIIFIGMFLWGGVQYMTGGGNQAQVDKAKKTLLWAVIGLLAVLSAFAIVNLIISAVK